MIYILYFLHVLISIFLIGVVLLQSGKGADLSVFGGGGTQAAFGARGGANILHKLTVAGFVLFILTTLTIGFFQSRTPSVMSGVETTPATESGSEVLPSDIPAPPSSEGGATTSGEGVAAEVEPQEGPTAETPPAAESDPAATPPQN